MACLQGMLHLAAQSDAKAIFRIGIFDGSSREFATGMPNEPVVYRVGQNTSTKNWYAKQPVLEGVATAAQDNTAPRSIVFSLGNNLNAAYRLHVALLIENPCVPVLRISINGAGDHVGPSDPIYSHADVEFQFQGSYLHPGENTITLQPISEEDNLVPNASLIYDAIELYPASKIPYVEPSAQLYIIRNRRTGWAKLSM